MANPYGTVYLDGDYVAKDDVRISPDDRGFLFGDGVYEVVRCYAGRPFAVEGHLARLHRGLCDLRIQGMDAAAFAEIIPALLERNGATSDDALVYIQVTRGASTPRRHAFPLEPTPPTTYATLNPFRPRGDPAKGIAVITVPDIRWARCDIKSVNLLPNCLANQQAQEAGASEAIFVRDGVALEGTASSFLGVFDGEVRTAPANNYILPSITRNIVLDICREARIRHREAPIYVSDLPRAEELFLAGTTTEIMPIVQVDGKPVGNGAPGPMRNRLDELFRARVAAGR